MENSSGNTRSARKSNEPNDVTNRHQVEDNEPNDVTNRHQVEDIDVSMTTPCGSCEGCIVTKDCFTKCENCVQNYIQAEIENNPNQNILPCLKRKCHSRNIGPKRQTVIVRNNSIKDDQEMILNQIETNMEILMLDNDTTVTMQPIQTEPEHKKVKVRVDKPDSELKIIDMPKLNLGAAFNDTSGKKSERFKLVGSNVYRTCACLEMCQADSCACVRYLEECKVSCECGDRCSNQGLTFGEGKKVFLGTSDVHGTGCFADEDIKEGDFVGEYVGEIVSKVDAAKKRNRSKFLFTIGDKDFVIDASKFGSQLTRMNHKDEKSGENCEFKLKRVGGAWRVGVWALEDISKGVELFANYGEHYWI